MKKQAYNPYLPSWEYLPDGEPHIFGERVYVYGSHDKFDGVSFCLLDYVCWSAPVNELGDWRFEGVVFRRRQDPYGGRGIFNALYAPDVCRGADGRYYLYYFLGYRGLISVAVCDTPAGKYEYLGHVKYADGTLLGKKGEPLQFDPGVFADDDGKIYLYTGFGPVNYPSVLLGGHKPSARGPMGFELEKDMLTIKRGPVFIGVKGKREGRGTPYEGHEFFEASSLRKFDGKYYFIYSSFEGHELCWAVGADSFGPFDYGGVLVSNGDIGLNGIERRNARNYIGNTHGSVIEIENGYYVFYHRHTNRHAFSRQACAEKISFDGGRFIQAETTSCGLNGGPLTGEGEYEARIACNLCSEKGSYFSGVLKKRKGRRPYFTQSGKDREGYPDQYIANFCGGSVAGFKYFSLKETSGISVKVRGRGGGRINVSTDTQTLAYIEIPKGKGERIFYVPLTVADGVYPLYFAYEGKGKVDFISFELYRKKQ